MRTKTTLLAALLALSALIVPALALARGSGSELATVRAGTARFHNFSVADAAGYGPLHTCTDDESGLGAMGQHYVRGDLVTDTVFDLSNPEVLVYEPMPNGRQRLVAVEFVVFQDAWDAQFEPGETVVAPELFGRKLEPVPSPNRYGVPAFYQIHVWLWKNNPAGMFDDWNERVSCLGEGDPQ
jgi:hypothetical protein